MNEPVLSSRKDPPSPILETSPERNQLDAPPETIDGTSTASVDPVQGMIPGRSRRRTKLERVSMRTLATGGIIGIATALGALLVNNGVAGWIVGLAVGLTSVTLAAVLWSSRQL